MSRRGTALGLFGGVCLVVPLALFGALQVVKAFRVFVWGASLDTPLLFVQPRRPGPSHTADRIAAQVLGENPRDRRTATNTQLLLLYIYLNKEIASALPVVDAGPNVVLYSSEIWTPAGWVDGCGGTYLCYVRCSRSAQGGDLPETMPVRLNDGERLRTVTLRRDVPDLDGHKDVTIYSNHWARRGPHFVPTGSPVKDPGSAQDWTWASLSADARAAGLSVQGVLVQPTPDFLATYRARHASGKIAIIAGWSAEHRPNPSIVATVMSADGSRRRLDFDNRRTSASGWRFAWIGPVKSGATVGRKARRSARQ